MFAEFRSVGRRDRNQPESRKARPGEMNGRSKLSDGQVRLVRTIRVSCSPRIPYRDIAEAFELSHRHTKRLCMGTLRREAGGPIESREELALERESEVVPSLLQSRTALIRCTECGHKAVPTVEAPGLCLECHLEEKKRLSRLRSPTALAR